MAPAALCASRTLAEHAAILKSCYGKGAMAANAARDQLISDIARQLDTRELIMVLETIGLASGSALNIDLYRKWLEVWSGRSPAEFAIWFNIGVQFNDAGDKANAATSYRNALALKPSFYQASLNLGTLLETMGDVDAALDVWSTALQPDEARIALLNNRGRVRENLKKYGEAQQDFTASLLTDPNQPAVLHHWVGVRTRMCAWPVFAPELPGVSQDDFVHATRALTLLALSDDVAAQDRGNASWIEEKMPPAPCRLSPETGYSHDRLRIGYLSSDYCSHPIAYLVTELFEQHDRSRFEIFGYCSTKDDGSDVRRRLLQAFDRWVDVRGMSDEQAARVIRDDEIDILIDLNGLTLGSRLQVLRWRPAPVQLTYLGYNGPIPLPELDYIVADEFVIPAAMAASYRPAPLYVPGCYQVNDSQLPVAPAPTRQEVGLPTDRFVFCCFSNTYKITEQMFDHWMTILNRTPGSVLWLFSDNAYATINLKAEAAKRGVDEARILFEPRAEPAQYRARLALADLFLDTFPYNSGTTASDALRAGLPIVTLSGNSFISRMAGSLLTIMHLEDCIASTPERYVNLAIDLARDPGRYRDLRARVDPALWRATLGDTARFCAKFEAALTSVAISASPAHLGADKPLELTVS